MRLIAKLSYVKLNNNRITPEKRHYEEHRIVHIDLEIHRDDGFVNISSGVNTHTHIDIQHMNLLRSLLG